MQEEYYVLRAQIHAKHLSRETLESQLATALYVLRQRDKKDREAKNHE